MDQDLKAYLDERFERIDARFERIDGRFERMDERFERIEARMDARFTQVDERFERIEGRMDARFTQVDERFERVETEARHTRVLLEAMHGNIGLLTEGVVGTNERIDALRETVRGDLAGVKLSIDAIHKYLVPRVEALEARVERENRDVIDVLRERLRLGQI